MPSSSKAERFQVTAEPGKMGILEPVTLEVSETRRKYGLLLELVLMI